MNVTNRIQSLVKSEKRYYFIRLTICLLLITQSITNLCFVFLFCAFFRLLCYCYALMTSYQGPRRLEREKAPGQWPLPPEAQNNEIPLLSFNIMLFISVNILDVDLCIWNHRVPHRIDLRSVQLDNFFCL